MHKYTYAVKMQFTNTYINIKSFFIRINFRNYFISDYRVFFIQIYLLKIVISYCESLNVSLYYIFIFL